MAIEVNNTSNLSGSRVQGSPRGKADDAQQPNTSAERRAADREAVEISRDATTIRETQSKLERESAIDSERVNQIKAAIGRGDYPLDNARIAERFLALERQLDI